VQKRGKGGKDVDRLILDPGVEGMAPLTEAALDRHSRASEGAELPFGEPQWRPPAAADNALAKSQSLPTLRKERPRPRAADALSDVSDAPEPLPPPPKPTRRRGLGLRVKSHAPQGFVPAHLYDSVSVLQLSRHWPTFQDDLSTNLFRKHPGVLHPVLRHDRR
jgi:hypothetical protein